MQTQCLGHVVFYVRDMQRSLGFYRDLLGLRAIGPGDLPCPAVGLTSGRTHHELLLIEVGDAPGPMQGRRLGLYHVAFKVGDSLDALRSAYHEILDAGVPILGMSDHTVSQSLYVKDPDGNEVEIYVDDPSVNWKENPELVLSPIKSLEM